MPRGESIKGKDPLPVHDVTWHSEYPNSEFEMLQVITKEFLINTFTDG
jgi:hypothetical protein